MLKQSSVVERKKAKEQEELKKALLNVTEDLIAAKALVEIEKIKDEAMLACIGEGLIAVDKDRKILVINKAAEKILSWENNKIIGKKLTNLILADEKGNILPFDKRPIVLALLKNKPVNKTYFFVKKDRTSFPIAINVTPVRLDKKVIGAIALFRDVTHEVEINKAKSEFVSLASHQLRTPLGIIKWYLEALENEDCFQQTPQAIQKYLKEIYKNNERVLSLVRDLLSVSRIEQGQFKNIPKSVDPIQIIKELTEQMQFVAGKKNIALHLTIKCQEIPLISIDVLRFREVIENLISNAIEYTLDEGSVNVTVDTTNKILLVSVKDTGIGISKTDQKMLFTKFFKGKNAIKYNPEGSGLGLYIVKSYIEDWGGKISVKSVEKKGSTFTISLPMKGGDKNEENTSY